LPTTFFTSDEHFGHANIIKFCHRPFTDINHMRESIIDSHNSVVKKNDTVFHLGDMFWNSLTEQECFYIKSRLNGVHFYILGNHEKQMNRSQALRETFHWVKDVYNLQLNGYPNIWLSHYAHRVWPGSHKGAYHLYGHSHAGLKELDGGSVPDESPLSFDVGVDAQSFTPISLEEIIVKMKPKKEVCEKHIVKCKCGNKFISKSDNIICSRCGEKMVR
jgi:calcineurin-like phosphoesterase family protein